MSAGPRWITESESQSEEDVKLYTKTLTNAEIIALPSTGVEIVAAPGEGFLLVPIAVQYVLTIVEGYTGTTSASWVLIRGNIYASTLTLVETFLAASDGAGVYSKNGGGVYMEVGSGDFEGAVTTGGSFNTPISPFDNLPLTLKDDYMGVSNYGGGDAGNSLTVNAWCGKVALT